MEKLYIDNLTDISFKRAFIAYFTEFGYPLSYDDHMFIEMNNHRETKVLAIKDKKLIIAFVMFQKEEFTNWFIIEETLFIRELWVKKSYRGSHIASNLLSDVESFAYSNQISKLILTTDNADKFYLKNGFVKDVSYTAKNDDNVYIKMILDI